MIRKATSTDLDGITKVYHKIHTAEENGKAVIGWKRAIYPTRDTAEAALIRNDLFIMTDENDGSVIGAAILNQIQVPEYYGAPWEFDVSDEKIMVMHTLVIDPTLESKGYGHAFAKYYEQYALENGCHYLRIDTNEKNERARRFYKSLGYKEISVVPCEFNGIPDVNLVLLEKCLLPTEREYFLSTERMLFSKWREEDVIFANLLWGDSDVTRYICASGQFSKEEIENRLKREIENDRLFHIQYWLLFDAITKELIGCCGLRPYKEKQFEIGFHLRPEFWGRGYAIEAAKAVIEYAFSVLRAESLFAGHNPQNTASKKVLEKLGFQYLGDEFYEPTGLYHPSYEKKR